MMRAIDLFAGPGGWDVGAGPLGIEPVGVEYDDAACATRKAAGLQTVQADVAELDPVDFATEHGGGCDLLIASPPCQAWSMAGKRKGQDDLPLVFEGEPHEAVSADRQRRPAGPGSRDPDGTNGRDLMTTDELEQQLKREADRRDALDGDRDAVRKRIDELIRDLRGRGVGVAELADLAGMSKQAIHKALNR